MTIGQFCKFSTKFSTTTNTRKIPLFATSNPKTRPFYTIFAQIYNISSNLLSPEANLIRHFTQKQGRRFVQNREMQEIL